MKNRKILITVILCLSVFLIALDIYGVWKDKGGQWQPGKKAGIFSLERTDWNDDVKTAVNDLLERFEKDGLNTGEIIDEWCLVRDGKGNGLGFDTGFLTEYDGYHSHK